MTMTMTVWKDGDGYSGHINGSDFNQISKDTLMEDISAKIDKLC